MSPSLCRAVCYVLAVAAALLAARSVGGPYLLTAAVFIAVVAALGLALPRLVCASRRAPEAAAPRPAAPAPKPVGPPAPRVEAAPAPAPQIAAAPAPAPKPAAQGAHWSASVKAKSGRAGAGGGQTGLVPSAPLSEEATLRDGVGSWRYAGSGA